MNGSHSLFPVRGLDVFQLFMRQLHCELIKEVSIKLDAASRSIKETIGYTAVGYFPTVILIVYVLLKSSVLPF